LLKIVYPICCGIDVHKKFVVACIASTGDRGITTYKLSRFSTFTSGLKKLSGWLESNSCRDVCMESTGKYWIPVYNILENTCRVTLAHPKYLRAIRGKKTDKKDARWIADLFKHDLVVASFMPPLRIRQLRDLMRYRTKLTSFTSSEKNRLQNCLTVSNIQIASVVSDTFGVSSMKIISHLLENPDDKDPDIAPLLHGSMVKKADDICLAIDGMISYEQRQKMHIILSHYSGLEKCKAELESVILSLCEPYTRELSLVSTVPGIGNPFTAIAIISEIGADMSVFTTAKHLCSWAGLVSQNDESAGKKHSVRISRAGIYIKPLLVQCANAVVRSDKHPEIRGRYLSIRKRRGHKRAIIAIARMLLTAIYYILSSDEPYNPDLFRKADTLPKTRNITVDQAISFARRFGYCVN
jgi:transposase